VGKIAKRKYRDYSYYSLNIKKDVDVKEFLTVKGDFELEKEVAFNFVDEDIVYELEFDSGLDFTKDDLKISVLGEEMEIKSYDTDLMVVNRAPEKDC